jgi:type IV pilus assembly protein PilA
MQMIGDKECWMTARLSGGKRSGFTIIELLVVILILAILMAIALPLYLGALGQSEVTTCRTNMYSIAQAEAAYRARVPGHVYTTNLSDLKSDLGSNPTCPAGGTYSVTISDGSELANNGLPVPAGGIIVKCSIPSHGVFAPGIDKN